VLLLHFLNPIIMKANMGTTDRALRVGVALLIAVLYFTNIISGTIAIVLLAFAAIFALTSLISFCPLYAPFGISTCKVENKG